MAIALTALFLHEGTVSEGLLETHWLFEDLLLFPKLIDCLKSPLIGIKTPDPPSPLKKGEQESGS